MLAIRMQRTGRRGHAMFRMIVQDARLNPKSGKVVAQLGNYDPHTKMVSLDKTKAAFYLEQGAQPSERMARLLKAEGVKLPKWVVVRTDKKGQVRHPDKLQKDQPAAPAEAETPVAEAETTVAAPEAEAAEAVAETPADTDQA